MESTIIMTEVAILDNGNKEKDMVKAYIFKKIPQAIKDNFMRI